MTKIFNKQPAEVLDFDFDFRDFLAERGNDRITSAVIVAQAGITVSSSLTIDGVLVKVYLSGGTTGVKYKVTCTAQTLGGRVVEREFFLSVKDT